MSLTIYRAAIIAILGMIYLPAPGQAQNLNLIGVTTLRTVTTNLDGSGIRVGQVEAVAPAFEVNPGAVRQPTNLFTYVSAAGTATVYPNSVGTESAHANDVAANFYGTTGIGVATNVAHVDNYEAIYFITGIVQTATSINDSVVNQSFVDSDTNSQSDYDTIYDNYAAQYKTLFVSGAGNGGPVLAPSTCYNGISVGAFGGSSSVGPTVDNGRCKPDITAPSSVTSVSTPQVAGAAAVLMQAALRGDGGSGAVTNAASDLRTIKALLLDGAVKPADWTNSTSSPLDARYGAGVLNIFNSYVLLAGGKHAPIVSNTVSLNTAHPPTGATGTVGALNGWGFSTLSSSSTKDRICHYYFNVTNDTRNFIATATLVWNRQSGKTNINNLDLFLYDCANSNLVMCSTSLVDNVEHIYLPSLPQGRYDLQVWKAGGSYVSASETYALAWQFVPTPLLGIDASTNITLTWPVYPAGFVVASETNLASGAWSTNNLPAAVITNGLNRVEVAATNEVRFFRLRSP